MYTKLQYKVKNGNNKNKYPFIIANNNIHICSGNNKIKRMNNNKNSNKNNKRVVYL